METFFKIIIIYTWMALTMKQKKIIIVETKKLAVPDGCSKRGQ